MPITRRLLFAAPLAAPALARAQGAWPNRPVRILVGFAAGGGADILARMLASHMEKVFGQPFPVENRTGAGGRIATAAVARMPGDGYSLLLTSTAAQAAAPALYSDLPYDAVKDFTHISLLCTGPMVLITSTRAPYATLPEMIAHVKSRGRPLTYASAGQGSLGHLTGVLMSQTLGIPMEHVSYRGGSAPALTDMLAGTLEAVSDNFASAASHYRAGAVRVLASAGRQRLPSFPDMPTFTELGYPTLVANAWYALSGSPGMPPEVTEALHREVRVVLEQPAMQTQLEGLAMQAEGKLSPAEYNAFVAAEIARWTAVVQSAGITPG